jgi:hypothetical protein
MQDIDTSKLGHVAADLMDRVGRQFGPDASVGTVAIVVEVSHPDDDAAEATTITCACSDHRAWAQSGLLSFAANLVERQALNQGDVDQEE